MATTTTHAQIGIVDSSGNVNVIYPITTGADVSIARTSNANIPTTATTAQKLANALGALAFKNVADIISTDGAATSTTATWSSSVINTKLTELSSNINNKQNNLGFTPVQQGGGSGQNTNKIYIGWSGTELKAQVDATDFGAIAFKSQLNDYLRKSGGTMSGVIYGNNGGQFAPDGNVWIKTGGYDNWLSNILNQKINIEPEIYTVPTVIDNVSFTYYKFGKLVLVNGCCRFEPVKTPWDGSYITIMELTNMPNVPRPAKYSRMYAHAIASTTFYDCVVAFDFTEDGFIKYACSANNIFAEYYVIGMFVAQ